MGGPGDVGSPGDVGGGVQDVYDSRGSRGIPEIKDCHIACRQI